MNVIHNLINIQSKDTVVDIFLFKKNVNKLHFLLDKLNQRNFGILTHSFYQNSLFVVLL